MSPRLPILTFHALDDGAAIVSLSPRVFERLLSRLADIGLRTTSLAQVVACIQTNAPIPRRSVVITFDDGYESVYEVAFPVLRRLGGRVMLRWWDQIRAMHRHGIEFGAHTCTHPDLTQLPDDAEPRAPGDVAPPCTSPCASREACYRIFLYHDSRLAAECRF